MYFRCVKITGIIPARYASTRFPGKPLVDIKGKPMIQHVYERASEAKGLSDVIVATDDQRIFDVVVGFGGKVQMTREEHLSGTDRCNEVAAQLDADVIINIQGDEPFIHVQQIEDLVGCFSNKQVDIATLIKPIDTQEELFDENKPKVIKDNNDNAIYFSRQTIPFLRGIDRKDWLNKGVFYKHIGIYGYRKEVLNEITKLPVSALEKAEALEQLRWIESGYQIKTAITNVESVSIDRPEDLARLNF